MKCNVFNIVKRVKWTRAIASVRRECWNWNELCYACASSDGRRVPSDFVAALTYLHAIDAPHKRGIYGVMVSCMCSFAYACFFCVQQLFFRFAILLVVSLFKVRLQVVLISIVRVLCNKTEAGVNVSKTNSVCWSAGISHQQVNEFNTKTTNRLILFLLLITHFARVTAVKRSLFR